VGHQQLIKKLSGWLDMLRATYNWCWRDRVDGWHQQFMCGSYSEKKTQTEITPLACSLVKGTQLANPWKDGGGKAKKEGEKDRYSKRTVVLMQDANLQELKDALTLVSRN
jgi:putative transposase